MSQIKQFLAEVSASMGYDGEINQAVLEEAKERMAARFCSACAAHVAALRSSSEDETSSPDVKLIDGSGWNED